MGDENPVEETGQAPVEERKAAASEGTGDSVAEERSRESYESEIASLRREAAGYRTERNALRADAEKWREWEESQKSELERAQEALATAEAARSAAEAEQSRYQVAMEYGLEARDMPLLGSGDAETLKMNAERIVELKRGAEKNAPPLKMPRERLRSGSGIEVEDAKDDYPPAWKRHLKVNRG